MVNFNWLYQVRGKDTIFHFLVSEADVSHVIISGLSYCYSVEMEYVLQL